MADRFNLGEWQVDPELNIITCAGREIRLEPTVMALLVCLSEQAGAVVSKEELMRQVWMGRFVTDGVLTTSIWELRRALGDDARRPRFIQTVPRKGYRVIAPVSTQAETSGAAPPAPLSASPTTATSRAMRWKKPAMALALALGIALTFTMTLWLRDDRHQATIQSIWQWRKEHPERPELAAHGAAEAREAYLKGRQAWGKRTEDGVRQGLELFERAAQLAPDYAPAYAGQADALIQLALLDAMRPDDAFPKAKTAALRAVRLDDRRAEAQASLAMIRFCYEWDWAEAETGFRHAIALNPTYATARNWYGQYLWAVGRLDEAEHEIRMAQEFEPNSVANQLAAGGLRAMRGQLDQAIESYRRAIALDSDYAVAWKSLGKLYDKKGMRNDALVAYQRFRELTGAPTASQTPLQFVRRNRKDDPQSLRHRLSLLWKLKYIRPTYVARLYLDLGDKDRAFEWLDRALSERDSNLLLLRSDHSWDALRNDPRFAALARQVGLTL
jgi:DNA-binding winged helix-turn-helix (wHTH) protein/Tfp pilus assembly protein PilF